MGMVMEGMVWMRVLLGMQRMRVWTLLMLRMHIIIKRTHIILNNSMHKLLRSIIHIPNNIKSINSMLISIPASRLLRAARLAPRRITARTNLRRLLRGLNSNNNTLRKPCLRLALTCTSSLHPLQERSLALTPLLETARQRLTFGTQIPEMVLVWLRLVRLKRKHKQHMDRVKDRKRDRVVRQVLMAQQRRGELDEAQ